MMEIVAGILVLVLIGVLGAGLFKPGWALPGVKAPKRWQVAVLYPLAILVIAAIAGPPAEPDEGASAPADPETALVERLDGAARANLGARTIEPGIRAHCEQVAAFGGSPSYATLQGCVDMEEAARANLEARSIEPRINAYCEQVAGFGGSPSYATLQGCVDMEEAARVNLEARTIESGIRAHCEQVAAFGGSPSYATLQGCVDMEEAARSKLQ